MRVTLINREKLQSLGRFLVDEFDSLVARIRAGWTVEHEDDGSHGHVTSFSTQTGRLVFSDIFSDTIAQTNVDNYAPNITTAAILRLDSTLAEVTLTGLTVPLGEDGSVLDGRALIIENVSISGTTFILVDQSDASIPYNRFHIPGGPAPSNATNYFYLRPTTLTVLVYNAKRARWIIHSQSNENTIGFASFATSQNDLQVSGSYRTLRTWRVVPTAANLTISGLLSSLIPATERKILVNDGTFTMAILHQNTASASANRIACPGGVRYYLNPRESVEIQRVEGGGWRVIEKADQWIDVAFDADHFTASGGTDPAWTVAEGDVTTFAYQIDGNMMTVSFLLDTTSVSGAPTSLLMTIPAGRVAARFMRARVALAVDANVDRPSAYCGVDAGGTTIGLFKDVSATAWSDATDTTYLWGQITFMVRDDCASISENHNDLAHGDQPHGDSAHLDTAHSDVAFSDGHSDSAHTDGSHSDVAFVDSHGDTSHVDSHADTPFVDDHTDEHVDTSHVDSHGDTAFVDSHGDTPFDDIPHADDHEDHDDTTLHEDSHIDGPHGDTIHVDSHGDTSHVDSHADTPFVDDHTDEHVDTSHVDSHGDAAFSDSHADTPHQDSSHGDVAHGDHSDVVLHADVPHVDQAAVNTPHGDNQHIDQGLECDPDHVDQ